MSASMEILVATVWLVQAQLCEMPSVLDSVVWLELGSKLASKWVSAMQAPQCETLLEQHLVV